MSDGDGPDWYRDASGQWRQIPPPPGATTRATWLPSPPAAPAASQPPVPDRRLSRPVKWFLLALASAGGIAYGVYTANSSTPRATVNATLYQDQGSGEASLPQFTVTDSSWHLSWSYDCSSYPEEGQGSFIVEINGYGGASEPGVDELGTQGKAVESYYDSGTFNLQVFSVCDWSVSVSEP